MCALSLAGLLCPDASFADEVGEWFARVGALEAIYHSSAIISSNAGTIPGATAKVSDNTTVLFDVGYDVTSNIFVMLMGGLPPQPDILGRGTVTALGKLGDVRYGPAILTAGYRAPTLGEFQPYVGVGVAYAIILHSDDAAVSSLKVHNDFGFALQAGVEYALSQKWQAFVDVKQLWLSVSADGLIGGVDPVAARVKLNPTLISAGIKFQIN
jgi:outer membrane protein